MRRLYLFQILTLALVVLTLSACNGKAKKIAVSEDKLAFTIAGGEKTVKVTADGSYEVQDSPEWLTVETGDSTVTIKAGENKTGAERKCEFHLVGADGVSVPISVTQQSALPQVAGQSATEPQDSVVQDTGYDEEEAKAFAYSYFKRPHGCSDLAKNKHFFTPSSYKTIKAKIDRMMRNYEYQSPGDDPFDIYEAKGSKTQLKLSVKSLGDGVFQCKETEEGLIGDVDPYYIKSARIKVVKIDDEYKIAALYDFFKKKWVP